MDQLTAAKIAEWRDKASKGTLTLDEMKEAIVMMRGGRFAAATASASSAKKRTAAKAAVRPAAELLGDLLNMGGKK